MQSTKYLQFNQWNYEHDTGLYIQKEYTSLGTSFMQILLLSAHAIQGINWPRI